MAQRPNRPESSSNVPSLPALRSSSYDPPSSSVFDPTKLPNAAIPVSQPQHPLPNISPPHAMDAIMPDAHAQPQSFPLTADLHPQDAFNQNDANNALNNTSRPLPQFAKPPYIPPHPNMPPVTSASLALNHQHANNINVNNSSTSPDHLKNQLARATPLSEALLPIAPRKPGASNLSSRLSSSSAGKPRERKRRRQTGAGKHWAAAANRFVQDIPPVPYFSDPRRNAPQRDMRGWISTIAKPTQKLVWDRLMCALRQDDLNNNGDEDICRHILGSVIHEAQDPTSEKKQTRQAVNNAIKRELSTPKACGQTGRGETFRELFREKAMGAGFRLTPVEKAEKEEVGMAIDTSILRNDGAHNIPRSNLDASASLSIGNTILGGNSNLTGASNMDNQNNSALLFRSNDSRLSNARGSGGQQNHLFNNSFAHNTDPLGFSSFLEPMEAARWSTLVASCERTAAGEIAWWTAPDLKVHDMNHLGSYLVRSRNVAVLKKLLIDFRWLRICASSSQHGIMNLVKDGYDVLLGVKTKALSPFEREGYRLIRNALMLVTPILRPQLIFGKIIGTQDLSFCAHLGTQLFGRLLNSSRRFAVVATLLESIRVHVVCPWLRPLNPCFDGPKTDISLAVKSGPGALASAVAISADGELLVTTGTELRGVKPNVRVWEVSSGNCLSTIPVQSVLILAISPDKKYVVSVSMGNDGPLMFWNIMDDKRRFIENVKEETVVRPKSEKPIIFSIVITPDSQHVISASDGAIIKWNLETGERVAEFDRVAGTVYSIDLSPDGRLLVAGTAQGVIGLWDVETGRRLLLLKNEGEAKLNNAIGAAPPLYPISLQSGTDLAGNKLPDNMAEVIGKRVFSVSFMIKRTIPTSVIATGNASGVASNITELNSNNHSMVNGKGMMKSNSSNIKIVTGGEGVFRIWTLPDIETMLNAIALDDDKAKAGSKDDGNDDGSGANDNDNNNDDDNNNNTGRKGGGGSYQLELTQCIEGHGLGIINNMRCTDCDSIFFASGDGSVRLWKLDQGTIADAIELGTERPERLTREAVQHRPENTAAIFLAVSDDGQKVAASTERPFVLVWDVGQYVETLKENKKVNEEAYFACQPGSVSFTDIGASNNSNNTQQLLAGEFNKYLSNSSDSKRELRILRKKENENDLKLVFHPDGEDRSIVFDQNIDLDHCRVGVFIEQYGHRQMRNNSKKAALANGSNVIIGGMKYSNNNNSNLQRREGLGVRFKDKNIAFFEAERAPPDTKREI